MTILIREHKWHENIVRSKMIKYQYILTDIKYLCDSRSFYI